MITDSSSHTNSNKLITFFLHFFLNAEKIFLFFFTITLSEAFILLSFQDINNLIGNEDDDDDGITF